MIARSSEYNGLPDDSSQKAKQDKFLESIAKTGHVTHSCQVAGVARCTHSYWLKDPTYAYKYALAREQYIEKLEAECDRRAVDGIKKPVFHQGVPVGSYQVYSDALLMFRLRAMRRDVYGDGQPGQTIDVDPTEAEDDSPDKTRLVVADGDMASALKALDGMGMIKIEERGAKMLGEPKKPTEEEST